MTHNTTAQTAAQISLGIMRSEGAVLRANIEGAPAKVQRAKRMIVHLSKNMYSFKLVLLTQVSVCQKRGSKIYSSISESLKKMNI
jgi:hypothetical protein